MRLKFGSTTKLALRWSWWVNNLVKDFLFDELVDCKDKRRRRNHFVVCCLQASVKSCQSIFPVHRLDQIPIRAVSSFSHNYLHLSFSPEQISGICDCHCAAAGRSSIEEVLNILYFFGLSESVVQMLELLVKSKFESGIRKYALFRIRSKSHPILYTVPLFRDCFGYTSCCGLGNSPGEWNWSTAWS